jgi:hypothetical protein
MYPVNSLLLLPHHVPLLDLHCLCIYFCLGLEFGRHAFPSPHPFTLHQ